MLDDERIALRTSGLTKRYRRVTALEDCTIQVPKGRVSALVGPNGAGKTTLMSLACGMREPSSGEVIVLGRRPDNTGPIPGLAYLAQQRPLYRGFTVDEMVRAAVKLNPGFDENHARELIDEAEVPTAARVKQLSGGQHSRVALALALGRRPEFIVMDEPLADLDPLARKDVMSTLMTDVADSGTTVLLSSHVISDVEDVCDHLVLLTRGSTRLCGDIDDLLAEHHVATGSASEEPPFAVENIVEQQASARETTLLLRGEITAAPNWEITKPTVEELVLSYMRSAEKRGRA